MKYVSLHTHSTYSYGDGYGSVASHVERVAALGMTAVALTEHGNVSSWVALEKACKRTGLKPIFGLEAYIAPENERRKNHMILLAMNETGLTNLNRIVTQSFKQFYQFPTTYWKDLVKWNEGIIALSGCSDSQLSCILLGGKSFGDKRLEPRAGDFQRAVREYRGSSRYLVTGITWKYSDFLVLSALVLLTRYWPKYQERQAFPLLRRATFIIPTLTKTPCSAFFMRRTGEVLSKVLTLHGNTTSY